MKISIAFMLVFFSMSFVSLNAQITAYSRTVLTGLTYTDMTLATAGPTGDDATLNLTLPFTFTYDGVGYTTLSVCTNGWVSFAAAGSTSFTAGNLFTNTAPNASIGGWWGDGNSNAANGGSITADIHPSLAGVYVVQFKEVSGSGSGAASATNKISYQIHLYGPASTNPGRIEILYGPSAGTISTGRSIGIENVTSGTNNYINALNGLFNSTATSTAWVGNGNGYRFDPPPACSGTPVAGTTAGPAVVCSGANFGLSLTGATTGVTGLTYQWQSSPDGITYTNIAAATAATATVNQTAATYYQCIVTCTNGGAADTSTALQVNMSTPTYATIPYTEGFEATWINGCATKDIPSNSWRNTPVTGNNSWRRQNEGATAAWGSATGLVVPTSGTGAANFHSYNASNGSVGTLDLYIDLSTASPVTLGFKYQNASGVDSMQVFLSTDGGATFGSALGTYKLGTWAQQTINLGVVASATSVIRFRSTSDFGNDDIGIDDVNVALTPACVAPTALALVPASSTSANMTWTCTACTGSFIVEYGAVGFVPGTGATAGAGTVVTAASSPFLLTGLTANTTYDVYVRQDCGGTYSSNAGPVKYIPGDICVNAIDLATLTSPYSGTTTGAGSDYTNTCAGGNTAPDLVYSLVVPPYYTLVIGQTVNGYDSENTLFYGGSCPGTTQIACFDDPDVQNVTWTNSTGTTQTVYWVQDGYAGGQNGTFTLAWSLTPPVYDVRALNLASPAATGCYTNAETVSVTIRNDGTAPIDYSVNPVTVSGAATGTNPQAFTPVVLNAGTLAVGATQVVDLSTAYDMSAAGTYTFDATATFTGDALATNDTMPTTTRTKTNPVVTASSDTTICIGSSAQLNATVVPNAPSGVFTNTIDVSIPDDDVNGTTSVIAIAGVSQSASSIASVRINMTHTWDSDMNISLIAPDLSTIDLSSANGGGGDNYTNTVFVPTGAPSITTGVAPMTGNYTPEQPFSNLTGGANGNWTLKMVDGAAGDLGTLLDWTITFNIPEGIASYSWSPATGLTSTTIANPIASPTGNTTYTVVVTDNNGCTSTDSVAITVSPLPSAPTALGTSVCSGNAAALTASGAGTLGWYTASTGGTYLGGGTSYTTGALTVDTTFYVRDSSSLGCVSPSTAVLVTINPDPAAPSAASTAICANDSILLSATGVGVLGWYDAPTAGNYITGGSTYQTPALTSTTLYYVQDSNATTGCVSPRTIVTVTVNANPVVDLGADTTQCAGTVVLDAGVGPVDYLWNDNSIAQTLTAAISGTYSVTVTDTITGCFSSDTILVTINPLPIVDLGADSVQCGGSVVLDAGNTGSSYVWTDNTTAQTLSASASGQYYVTVTDVNNCSASDSVNIVINALPVVDLGNDSTQCGGGIVLDAGTDGTDYLWNDNTIAQTLTAFVTGQYYVTVTDSLTGCFATDSINVTLNQYPIVDLGADTTQCAGTVVLNASNTGASFLWNDNSTAQTLTVSATGQYFVAVTQSGCTTNDTIEVTINPLPLVGLSPFTTPICNDLTAFVLTNGSPAGGVYSGANVTGNTFNAVAAGVGVYPITYTVTDTNGCSNSSTQNLTVQNCTGIEEYTSYEVVVYPNPTSGAFTLSIKNANIEELIISVVDIQGKEVFGVRERNITADYNKVINLENVSKGMYYIKLSTGSDMKIQKLIVQ
ncbi:MAG: T9SS type A sorting domain-containing protein [Bacteroidia bacterium]|nr:T9SS type A sorting domain-containing protein [Bacteroidia bacterium]